MLPISSNAIIEKNKITSDGKWLLLLKVEYEDETPIRVCLNNVSIIWNSQTWLPAIFNLSGLVESKDAEVPSIPLTIFDPQRNLIPILEAYDGGVGAIVTIYVVHSKYLSNLVPEFEEQLEIIDVSIDDKAVITFKLGGENLYNRRCPQNRYLKNSCRFIFKSATLAFTSGGTTEPVVDNYLKGATSTHTAKITGVRIISGSWSAGTAAGYLDILTINGTFQAENLNLYSDSEFTTSIQSNVATISAASSGRCGYTGPQTSCNRSFARCRELGNNLRFGGFPGLANTGFLK